MKYGLDKLEVFEGGKGGILPAQNFEEKVNRGFEIEDGHIFNEGRVLALIKQAAEADGIDSKFLELKKKIYDSKKNLISIEVNVKEGRAKGSGWAKIEYYFNNAGEDEEEGLFGAANIIGYYYHADHLNYAAKSSVLATYESKHWEFFQLSKNSKKQDAEP